MPAIGAELPVQPEAAIGRNCPRLCENHFAGHLGARLIQAVRCARIKDSPKLRFRFYCCVLTTGSCVFTQVRRETGKE
jgi:hypothetical protein